MLIAWCMSEISKDFCCLQICRVTFYNSSLRLDIKEEGKQENTPNPASSNLNKQSHHSSQVLWQKHKRFALIKRNHLQRRREASLLFAALSWSKISAFRVTIYRAFNCLCEELHKAQARQTREENYFFILDEFTNNKRRMFIAIKRYTCDVDGRGREWTERVFVKAVGTSETQKRAWLKRFLSLQFVSEINADGILLWPLWNIHDCCELFRF